MGGTCLIAEDMFNSKLNTGQETPIETENRSEEITQNKAQKDDNMGKKTWIRNKDDKVRIKSVDRELNLKNRRKCGGALFVEVQLGFSRNNERHQPRFQKPNKYQTV